MHDNTRSYRAGASRPRLFIRRSGFRVSFQDELTRVARLEIELVRPGQPQRRIAEGMMRAPAEFVHDRAAAPPVAAR